jgi:hypothetical protein
MKLTGKLAEKLFHIAIGFFNPLEPLSVMQIPVIGKNFMHDTP